MSGATRVNIKKPDDQNNQRIIKVTSNMWVYFGLLSGSLLMVGGVASSRFSRLSRSFGWSLLRFTTSVTGIYLTFSSIQRLYNNSIDSISEEAENSSTSFEHSQIPENLDKSIENNSMHVAERTESTNSIENIVENFTDDTDEENTALDTVTTDIDINAEENNFIDSNNQNSCIVLTCESTDKILPEKDKEVCTNAQDVGAEVIEYSEVVESEVFDDSNKTLIAQHVKINISVTETNLLQSDVKGCEIEVKAAKEDVLKTDVTVALISSTSKNIEASESLEKDMKMSKTEENSSMESDISFSVGVDNLTKDEYNNASVTNLKEQNFKDLNKEKIIETDINIPDKVAADNLITDKLGKDISATEVIEEDFITQKEEINKCITEKDKLIMNVVSEGDLIESNFDKDTMTILDVTKEDNISENCNVISDPLTDDANKNNLSEESKIDESNVIIDEDERKDAPVIIDEDERKAVPVIIDEDERKYVSEKDNICTITVTGKDTKESKIGESIIKDVDIELPKAKDCIIDKIENIIEELESLENLLADNENKYKHNLTEEVQKYVFKENITEQIEDVTDDVFMMTVGHEDEHDINSIKNISESEPREMVFKEPKYEDIASMHPSVRNLSPEKNDNKSVLEISKNDLEECNFYKCEVAISKDITMEEHSSDHAIEKQFIREDLKIEILQDNVKSEVDISKDITVEEHSSDHAIEEKVNKENLKMEISQENVKESDTKEVIPKNDTLVEKSVSERGLSENIEEETSLEEVNIIEDGVKSDPAKRISIEGHVVKNILEDTSFKDIPEEVKLEKDMFSQDIGIEDGNSKNTVDEDIYKSGIDSPCIVVDKTVLSKDSEIQNNTVEEATDEQNVNQVLGKEFNTTMSLTEEFPKLSDSPTVRHINQLLSNSTDDLQFISPNTASDIGVFFKKSNKTKLAARFTNTSTVPVYDCKELEPSLSQQTIKTSVTNEYPLTTNTVITTPNKQSSKLFTSFKDAIAWKPFKTASTEKNRNFKTTSSTSESVNYLDINVESSTSKQSISPLTDVNLITDTNKRQSIGAPSSSVAFHKDKTCEIDLFSGQSSSDSENSEVPISEVPKNDKGVLVLSSLPGDVQQSIIHSIQSPTFLDIAGISPADRHLRLPETTTFSPKDSSPATSDRAVSNPVQNISENSPSSLPKPIGSPNKPNKCSPKASDIKFAGHSPRSPTDAFLHDRHSPKSSDIDNSFRHTIRSPVGGVGHIRRATWSSAALQSRRTFGRGIPPRSESPAEVSEDDVFAKASDSPWTSCDNISQSGHTSKRWGRDVFSLARKSPWSSCGDVPSQARLPKRTKDSDVFSNAHHSPWVSGSGTIFHSSHSRKPRSSSHPRHSRIASSGSCVSRVRHSLSPKGSVPLPTEKSPTRNITSPRGKPLITSLSEASSSKLPSVSTEFTVQSTDSSVSVDIMVSDR